MIVELPLTMTRRVAPFEPYYFWKRKIEFFFILYSVRFKKKLNYNMESTYMETIRAYMDMSNANGKALDDMRAHVDALNFRLDKTIELLNRNFKKLNEKIKTLQLIVDSLQKTIAADRYAREKERTDRMAEDLAHKLSTA